MCCSKEKHMLVSMHVCVCVCVLLLLLNGGVWFCPIRETWELCVLGSSSFGQGMYTVKHFKLDNLDTLLCCLS